jgi:sulfatase maturation enzyme AslB (radical SAM superfamily)
MISVTKLLFNDEYFGDSLRYSHAARGAANGTTSGSGPVVVWNSTRTCNLKCIHCYMDSDAHKYQGELTTAEARHFIDDLAEFRVPVLLFSGGEPLIRPDFFELAEYTAEKGIRPTLSTNGTLAFHLTDCGRSMINFAVVRGHFRRPWKEFKTVWRWVNG